MCPLFVLNRPRITGAQRPNKGLGRGLPARQCAREGITPVSVRRRCTGEFPLISKRLAAQLDLYSVHLRSWDGRLFHSVHDGDSVAIQEVLAAGASIDAADNETNTPLHHAAVFGHANVVNATLV
jgi:hypothetical protein